MFGQKLLDVVPVHRLAAVPSPSVADGLRAEQPVEGRMVHPFHAWRPWVEQTAQPSEHRSFRWRVPGYLSTTPRPSAAPSRWLKIPDDVAHGLDRSPVPVALRIACFVPSFPELSE